MTGSKNGEKVNAFKEVKIMDSKTMYKLTYGLFVLTAREGEKDNGCIINTAIQVTSQPNRISIAVNKSNYTHDMIKNTGIFNVSIISTKADFELFKHWGFQSGRDTDKAVGVELGRAGNGLCYIVNGTNAYISAKVIDTIDLGTHTMFIADVTDGEVLSSDESCTYAFYQSDIKAKANETKETRKGWICTVCGYIYEGEILPDDFICPICKHPASDFKKL